MKFTYKECECRKDGLCLKDLANGTGEVEPCDFCNCDIDYDIDYEYQLFEKEIAEMSETVEVER